MFQTNSKSELKLSKSIQRYETNGEDGPESSYSLYGGATLQYNNKSIKLAHPTETIVNGRKKYFNFSRPAAAA